MPTCDVCGYESDTEHGVATHASIHDRGGGKKKTYECQNCNDTFEDYPSRRETRGRENFFCSRGCKNKYEEKEKFYFECATCGEEVVRHPSTSEQMGDYEIKNHFCDKECESQYKSTEWVEDGHPSWVENTVEMSCDECSKDIEVNEYYLDKQNNFFCSNSCHYTHMTGQTHANCDWCDGRFELKTAQRNSDSERYFCTHNCYRNWMSKWQRGDKNPAWRGGKVHYYGPNWNQARIRVLDRDDEECKGCGMTRDDHYKNHGRDLEIHHITPLREFDGDFEAANDINNLVTLCIQCHAKAEYHDLNVESAVFA